MTLAPPLRSAKAQFDKQASEYNEQWNDWSKETLAWLLEHLDAAKSDRILDVATGTGFTALAFASRAARVDAVDVSEGMLAEAGKRAQSQQIDNVFFQVAAAEALPFDDGAFDIAVCRIAAHHFLDIRAYAAESFRTLKAGGRLLIVDTTVPDESPEVSEWQNRVEAIRDPSHVRNHSPSEWRELLSESGFDVVECTTSGSGITIPLADWIKKAGCSPEQDAAVRAAFAEAPQSARSAFRITGDPHSEDASFTWQRVAIRADKPV